MITVESVTTLNDINARLREITEVEIDGWARKLIPIRDGETRVAKLNNLSTKALYALWQKLSHEKESEELKSKIAVEAEVEADHQQREMIADGLSDVARHMFWAEARNDIGFWKKAGIGLRDKWMIVEISENDGHPLLRALKGLV